jgi:hypothetical protein
VVPSSATVTNLPSGPRMIGNATSPGTILTRGAGVIAPAIDDASGSLTYLRPLSNSLTMPNAHNVAPQYLPTYPVESGFDPATLNCFHLPADNGADHGPSVTRSAVGSDPASLYNHAPPAPNVPTPLVSSVTADGEPGPVVPTTVPRTF